MGRELRTGHDGVIDASRKGEPAGTDRPRLTSLSYSFTLAPLRHIPAWISGKPEVPRGRACHHNGIFPGFLCY